MPIIYAETKWQGDVKGLETGTNSPLWNDKQVANFYGVSVATIRRWRLLNTGPRHIKLSGSVRYRPEECIEWLETRANGNEPKGAK